MNLEQYKKETRYHVHIPIEKPEFATFYHVWWDRIQLSNHKILTTRKDDNPTPNHGLSFICFNEIIHSLPIEWLTPLDFEIGSQWRIQMPKEKPSWAFNDWCYYFEKLNGQIVTIYTAPTQSSSGNTFVDVSYDDRKVPYMCCIDWLVPISSESPLPGQSGNQELSSVFCLKTELEAIQRDLETVRQERDQSRQNADTYLTTLNNLGIELNQLKNYKQEMDTKLSNLLYLEKMWNDISKATGGNFTIKFDSGISSKNFLKDKFNYLTQRFKKAGSSAFSETTQGCLWLTKQLTTGSLWLTKCSLRLKQITKSEWERTDREFLCFVSAGLILSSLVIVSCTQIKYISDAEVNQQKLEATQKDLKIMRSINQPEKRYY